VTGPEPDVVLYTEFGHLRTDGGDTVIALAPSNLSIAFLLTLAEDMAALVDSQLHSAEFWSTTDPEVVRTFGVFPMHDGCERCAQGVERAVEHLQRHPDQAILVGRLYWAHQRPIDDTDTPE